MSDSLNRRYALSITINNTGSLKYKVLLSFLSYN